MTSFRGFGKIYIPEIEKEMNEWVEKRAETESLKEAMLYSLNAGGKRFRPLLLLSIPESFGVKISRGMIATSAALEMVHTYSLIHDDLPAMDNDDLRRGKPTSHKKFGEAMAILAGDALLTSAFGLTALSGAAGARNLILMLSHAAGEGGMVAGQVLDIEGEGAHLDLAKLKNVHAKKTGALILYAVQAGLELTVPEIMKNYSEDDFEDGGLNVSYHLTNYAKHVGVAFQIRDDILDVTKTSVELGKTAGKDEAADKSTYPSLLGLDGAKVALEQELTEARTALIEIEKESERSPWNFDATLLTDILSMLEV
jgi:geranylgeranyl diphosphate synthase type II